MPSWSHLLQPTHGPKSPTISDLDCFEQPGSIELDLFPASEQAAVDEIHDLSGRITKNRVELLKLISLWSALSNQWGHGLCECLTFGLCGLLLVEVEWEVLDDERCHGLAQERSLWRLLSL